MPKLKLPLVSIIIVNYRAAGYIKKLINSLPQSNSKLHFEVIIVDNQPSLFLKRYLSQNHPRIRYLAPPQNLGFGAGNNLGTRHARGRYLFFLNPDTLLDRQALPRLVNYLSQHPRVGVVAPTLLTSERQPYPKQGSGDLTPAAALFSLTVLERILPKNRLSRRYWLTDQDRSQPYPVAVVPGTALVIRTDLFHRIGGFDPRFFLYFEESDLARRVRQQEYQLVILPQATVVHHWGKSTSHLNSRARDRTFRHSRLAYFRKHFGLPSALLVETFASLNLASFLFLTLLAWAAFLRFYKIETLMPFIGDFGRDFIAARDLVLSRDLPLLGIPSSVPRFHQGPLYVWFLAGVFSLTGFSVFAAGLLAATLGLLAVGATYLLAERFLPKTSPLLPALLLATSPLAVLEARSPFHTNAIPLFSAFYLYSLFLLRGRARQLFLAGLAFALLFQFELVTAPLLLLIPLLWLFSRWRLTLQRLLALASGLTLGLLPQIIYDLSHRFAQVGTFLVWIGYRIASFLGFYPEHTLSLDKSASVLSSLLGYSQRFFYWPHSLPAVLILLLTGALLVLHRHRLTRPVFLLLAWISLSLSSFLVLGNASQAYFPSLFVPACLLVGWSFSRVSPARLKLALFTVFLVLGLANSRYLLTHDFLLTTDRALENNPFSTYGLPLDEQLDITRRIVNLNQPVRLLPNPELQPYPSHLDNYNFLITQSGGLLSESGVNVWLLNQPAPPPPPDTINFFYPNTILSLPLAVYVP